MQFGRVTNFYLGIPVRRSCTLNIFFVLIALAVSLGRSTSALATWTPDGVAVCGACDAAFILVAQDGAGGAFVVWNERLGLDIHAQRITASGEIAAGWPQDGVLVSTAPGAQYLSMSRVKPDGMGGFLAAWTDGRNYPSDHDVYAQRILADGSVAPGWPVNGVAVAQGPKNQSLWTRRASTTSP